VSKDEFIRSDTNLDGVLDEQELMARAAANDQAEKVVLTMEGPFTQVTGGKGANAAAAVGQTCAGGGCVSEFIGQFGAASSAENIRLLVDLKKCSVDVSRSPTDGRWTDGHSLHPAIRRSGQRDCSDWGSQPGVAFPSGAFLASARRGPSKRHQ